MIQKKSTEVKTLSEDFIGEICDRLSQGQPALYGLPLQGRLQIERTLPFLIVYRRPANRQDVGTDRLVKGEASYLIASGSQGCKAGLGALVQQIARTLASQSNAFLVIEIWSAHENQSNAQTQSSQKPFFRILTSKVRPPTSTVEVLAKALNRIKILREAATVEVVNRQKRAPAGFSPLISANQARRLNCFLVGLEIRPIYQNPVTDELFPNLHRTLHRGLGRALKKALFEFAHSQTSHRPAHYQVLGRRAMVQAVWQVDRQLAAISTKFGFLLQVTPVNVDWAWHQFMESHFERMPALHYRPLTIDTELLKRQLYEIPVERIVDPTLGFLFREKRIELDRQLSMLRDRGKRDFFYGSLQLYGEVKDDLLQLAKILLKKIAPHNREDSASAALDAAGFAKRARAEIRKYRRVYPDLTATVEVRDDTVGLMVSQGNLLIGQSTIIPVSRVEALLAHEVGTHVITYFNGKAQPFHQMYLGLAGYDEIQEGLAVLAEYLVGGLSRPRLRLLAGRVIAAQCLIEDASFMETYRHLHETHGFDQRTAFTITVRIYRGGGLTKDAVYLRGLVVVLDYLKKGGELNALLVGKIAASHISIVKELQWREILRQPPLRPSYLDFAGVAKKLADLRKGLTVLQLISQRQKH